MIDRDIHLAKALLVESNALLRSVATGQLRDLGIGQVSNASRVKDARLLLERERFDIVICNRDFEGSDYSGQDLLDELRRENLLPHSTVFLMVVQTATYHQVMEAAEAALDGLLVRPYTAAVLSAR
ncbi:MAG TPA: response regulator, partial [Rubrivivax sp.]|nr:response regulator [Rubrivivax sp.]